MLSADFERKMWAHSDKQLHRRCAEPLPGALLTEATIILGSHAWRLLLTPSPA
jgi:hypothetical protein